MKKIRYVWICFLILLLFMFLSGCSHYDNSTASIEKEEKNIHQENNSTSVMSESDFNEDLKSMRYVKIYYIDESSADVACRKVEIRDEFDIWDELKTRGVLTEECKLIDIKINKDKTMDLNFNSATGEWINSMGTTGETEIIGCVVNTYLEAYNCTGIRLLMEGDNFVSSHGADLDDYLGRVVFN